MLAVHEDLVGSGLLERLVLGDEEKRSVAASLRRSPSTTSPMGPARANWTPIAEKEAYGTASKKLAQMWDGF